MQEKKQLFEIYIDGDRLPGHGVSVLIKHEKDRREPFNRKLYASAYCTRDEIWTIFMSIYNEDLDIRKIQTA